MLTSFNSSTSSGASFTSSFEGSATFFASASSSSIDTPESISSSSFFFLFSFLAFFSAFFWAFFSFFGSFNSSSEYVFLIFFSFLLMPKLIDTKIKITITTANPHKTLIKTLYLSTNWLYCFCKLLYALAAASDCWC